MLNIKIPTNETVVETAESKQGFVNRNPSNWIIQADGDNIEATNNESKEYFYGSIAEFNERLRA